VRGVQLVGAVDEVPSVHMSVHVCDM
jgi:hypothetical protein